MDMEIKKLIDLIGQTSADAWEITEVKTHGWEFYFIRHRLDQNRLVRTTHTTVRIFRKIEDGKLLGSASEEIPPTASDEEALRILHALSERAGFVRNPAYTLLDPGEETALSGDAGSKTALPGASGSETAPSKGSCAEGGSVKNEPSVSDIARNFIKTMEEILESADADLNSYEIFANVREVHFVNSNGIDKVETYPDSMLEAVVNARDKGREIELYRICHMGSCDRENLTAELVNAMRFGRDRLKALPMPKLEKIPVLFTTSDAKEICRFFTDRMSASFKAQGYSDFEVGTPLFGGQMESRVTVEAVKSLPNSSCNRGFDAEGALRRDAVLIREGVPEQFLGDRQFSSYLGLKNSFMPGNYRLSGGTYSEEELRRGDYLEAVEFSDFQVDALSGNLAGEIRLAYWHHGKEVTPVTGGSISATLLEAGKTMKLTRALRQYDNMEIPAAIRLEDVSVTGVDDKTE